MLPRAGSFSHFFPQDGGCQCHCGVTRVVPPAETPHLPPEPHADGCGSRAVFSQVLPWDTCHFQGINLGFSAVSAKGEKKNARIILFVY